MTRAKDDEQRAQRMLQLLLSFLFDNVDTDQSWLHQLRPNPAYVSPDMKNELCTEWFRHYALLIDKLSKKRLHMLKGIYG